MVRLFSLAALTLMLVSVPMAALHAEDTSSVPFEGGDSIERIRHPPGSKGPPKNRVLLAEDVIDVSGLRPRLPPPPRPKSVDDEEGGDSIERISHPPGSKGPPKNRVLYENDVLSASGLRPSPPPPVRHKASEGKSLRH